MKVGQCATGALGCPLNVCEVDPATGAPYHKLQMGACQLIVAASEAFKYHSLIKDVFRNKNTQTYSIFSNIYGQVLLIYKHIHNAL